MKKFEQLLINSIDEEITGTTVERLVKCKDIFESEMLSNERIIVNMGAEMKRLHITKRLQDWLQGLCSAVSVPFMNDEIIAWYEQQLGRKAKKHQRNSDAWSTEESRWLEQYWPQCARTLYNMLYK